MLKINQVVMEDIASIVRAPINWTKLRDCNILITGVNGLIASYMVYTLIYLNDTMNLNLKVFGMARNKSKTEEKWVEILKRNDFQVIYQNVEKPFESEIKMDYIIHAASQTGPKQFVNDPVGTAMGNVLGTYQLLEYARMNGTKGFMTLSTREIYGKGSLEYVTEEDMGALDSAKVRSCYPESKRMAETLCASYMHQYDICCKVVRIAHTYGPQMLLSDGRVVGDFLGNIVNGQNIVMNSDGSGTLSLTYIADVIEGIFYTLCNFKDMVYNVSSSDEPITVKHLAQLLCSIDSTKNIKIEKSILDSKENSGYLNIKLGFLNSNKAKAEGWIPHISLKEGMERTIRSFENE